VINLVWQTDVLITAIVETADGNGLGSDPMRDVEVILDTFVLERLNADQAEFLGTRNVRS
jgi:hypothetical protein